MKGYKVHFKPGWDCHGLPIEMKAVSSNVKLTPLQIRDKGNADCSRLSFYVLNVK